MEEEDQNDRDAAQDVQSLVSHFKRTLLLRPRLASQPLPLAKCSQYRCQTIKPEFPIWISGLSIVRFSCLGHNEFASRDCPDSPPSIPDFATAIGVLPTRHRRRPDPLQHLAKQASV